MAWDRTVGGTSVERSAAVLVIGGVATVAGLWVAEFAAPGSGGRVASIALALLGGLGIASAIAAGLERGARDRSS